MPDPADTPPGPKKRGPNTPEGKARSSQNARKHGLRAERFVITPGEDGGAFEALCHDLRRTYAPEDRAETELVEAMAAGLWQACRAERMEAEALATMAPKGLPPHGGDLLAHPGHRASLGTVLRYQATAGNAVRRAFDLLVKHRKAMRDGLFQPEAEAPPVPANANQPPPGPAPAPLLLPAPPAVAGNAAAIASEFRGHDTKLTSAPPERPVTNLPQAYPTVCAAAAMVSACKHVTFAASAGRRRRSCGAGRWS